MPHSAAAALSGGSQWRSLKGRLRFALIAENGYKGEGEEGTLSGASGT